MKFLYKLTILILLACGAQICATHLTPENFKAIVAADAKKLLAQVTVLKSEGHYVTFDVTEKNNGMYEIGYRYTSVPDFESYSISWQMRQSIENFIEKYTAPTLVCVHELAGNPKAYAELLVKIVENVVALECLYEAELWGNPYLANMLMITSFYAKQNAHLEEIMCLKTAEAQHHAAEYLKQICKNAELDDKDLQAAIVAHAAAL